MVAGVFKTVGFVRGAEAAFVKRAVVRNKREACHKRLHIFPHLRERMRAVGVSTAVAALLNRKAPAAGMPFHYDRRVQYRAGAFRDVLWQCPWQCGCLRFAGGREAMGTAGTTPARRVFSRCSKANLKRRG
ncbi:MAG: hypothetical protein MdMp014T_2086 [Treponematales bacterium]